MSNLELPKRVKIVEVGPRDGLQHEPTHLPSEVRVGLVDRLSYAGFETIEVGSFVSPRWVPQMAGSDEVFARIRRRPGTHYTALVPNLQGLVAAFHADADEVAVFASATEGFSQRNINCSIEESFHRFEPLLEDAAAAGVPVRGYVSCVLTCPYDGDVDPAQVAAVAARLYDAGCYEISLGDTIGVGTPRRVAELIDAVAARMPLEAVAVHFHDTYGQALANVLTSLQQGVQIVDSAVAGLGGCPYARGASGNVGTEDVLYMLNGLDIETGVDLEAVIAAAQYICDELGRAPASKVSRAMGRRVRAEADAAAAAG